jgi:proteic killer suppression protein
VSIRSFRDAETETLFRTGRALGEHRQGRDAKAGHAGCRGGVAGPPLSPGNRLEALSGDRAGQHGIRVNDQWRVCLRWAEAGPEDVEITDYH